MKNETAIKRIKKAIEKTCKGESQKVKDYFYDLTYSMYNRLERDEDDFTSSENLHFAIVSNLEDEYQQIIKEARDL